MDLKGLKVLTSESDVLKLEVSGLGRCFSEKAEHLPIKKRRFVFKASSPPLGANDGKVDEKESGKAKASEDEDNCDMFLVGRDLDLQKDSTVKSEENIPGGPSKDVASVITDHSSPDNNGSTLDNSSTCPLRIRFCRMNQTTNEKQNSPAQIDRFNWDLNTVMDEWEEVEPLECSIPLHRKIAGNSACSKATPIGSGNNVDHAITSLETISENETQSSSLTALGHEDDEPGVKKSTDINRITIGNLDRRGGDTEVPNNVAKIKELSGIKFSRIQRYGLETEDMETKVEASRFYRRESLSRIGGSSIRDAFLDRSRFRVQGCSSNDADVSTSRPERELGALRSLRRGKYSPHIQATSPGSGTWNRSQVRDEDLNGIDRTRQSFRSRLPEKTEEDIFRARLGLRPSGDVNYNRLMNVGKSTSSRYGSTSRHDGGGPRGRYYRPSIDDHDEPSIEYSHPRMRRPRSPIYRTDEYNFDPRNNLSSRKIKPNENCRPVKFSELSGDQTDANGYRRGGFVRRYEMGRPVEHFGYDEEDDYGPVYDPYDKDGFEFYGNGSRRDG